MAGHLSLRSPLGTPKICLFAACVVLASCAPRGVRSPIEKAPPPEIARARTLVANGNVEAARTAYERFLIAYPGTMEADLARLELGIVEAASRGCEQALSHFQQARDSEDQAIALRASLRSAACELDARQPEQALGTLEPLAAERFTESEQALLWHTAVEASEQTLDAPLGLRVMDTLWAEGGVPPDQERAEQVVDTLAMKLSIEQALVSFEEVRPDSLAQQAIARRMLEHGLETQDPDLVARALEPLRASDSVEDPEVRMLVARGDEFLHGNPYVVGALLPLSGRGREVGRQILQGMQLAALHEGGPELIVEDTGGSPTTTTTAMASLVDDQRVVAVLGPVAVRSISAAAEASRRAGVPLLAFSVSDEATAAGEQVFRVLYSPRDEVRALVRTASARGARRYVALYPDHGYGRTLSRIFEEEVAAIGGISCAGVAYPRGTRSFVDYVKNVLDERCDAVLLADVADQVASIAPTFAAEGAWSAPPGRPPGQGDRAVHFLLPSPSWSPTLIGHASRYLQGALIVVPFYAASEAPTSAYFREAYEERYGRTPGTFAAYGYDIYRMVSVTLRQGYQTREALNGALQRGAVVTAVTSMDGFSEGRTPGRGAPVYEVRGTALELQP